MNHPYSIYRDSGVEWLGEIPEHWELRLLGRMGSFFKGGGGTKEDEVEDGFPCVRYGDLYTQHEFVIRETRACIGHDSVGRYRSLLYGDVLFAGSGETIDEIGKSAVNLIEGVAYCGGDVIVFRPSVKTDASFLGYAADCRAAIYQKACMGRGVTVMHIYSSELKRMLVPAPPVNEQRAIAEFLDRETAKIDSLVAKKRLLLERLAEYRTALITRTVTKGLPHDAATQAGLNPNPPLKASGVEWLGDIPEHWDCVRLRDVADLVNGYPFDSQQFDPHDGFPLVRIRDLFTRDTEVKWSGHLIQEALIDDGDVLVGMDGDFNVAIWNQGPALLNQRLCCVRSRYDKANQRLIYYCLPLPLRMLNEVTYATTVKHLSSIDVLKFRLPCPPALEQEAIVSFLDEQTERIGKLSARVEAAIERLGEYRTALITAAVTGKIDVGGHERVETGADRT